MRGNALVKKNARKLSIIVRAGRAARTVSAAASQKVSEMQGKETIKALRNTYQANKSHVRKINIIIRGERYGKGSAKEGIEEVGMREEARPYRGKPNRHLM